MGDTSALLIANPHARSGDDPRLAEALARLERAGLQVLEARTENRADTHRVIGEHRERVDRVIVAGGDGTLNSVAGAVYEHKLALGILPMGTANDLARTLGIPVEIEAACDVIAADHRYSIDLGMVNDEYYFNVANIGLGTRITRELTAEVKKHWGVLSYLKALFAALKRNRKFVAVLNVDGQDYRLKTIQVAVGNGRFYGGGNVVDESAAIDDGLLSLYSIQPQPWWELLLHAPWLRGGKHREAHIFNVSGRRIDLKTALPMQIHADGEPLSQTPANFKVIAGAVQVIAPPKGGDGIS